jgi:hypothetical protein
MEPRPVRHCRAPGYPTRLDVLAHPQLLAEHVPPNWTRISAVCGAIGLFLGINLTVNGCGKAGVSKQPDKRALVVAPIFQHGEGRGATGCIVSAPPVFLSEEEALQVIREELATHGVMLGPGEYDHGRALDTGKFELSGVTVGWMQPESFKADAADKHKRVAIEFISERECSDLDFAQQRENSKDGTFTLSSVHEYDFPKTSNYLAEKVKLTGRTPVFFGTFYDPLSGKMDLGSSTNMAGFDNANAKIVTESKRLLRLQVQDFVRWLQGQGAL